MIKTMNNKMSKNTYLSRIKSKKQSKQEEQRQNHGEQFDSCQMRGRWWRMGEEVRGLEVQIGTE